MSAAPTLLAPLAAALLIAVTAYVTGRTLTRSLEPRGRLEIGVLSLSAGLLASTHLGLALGWLGALARGPLLAAFAVLHLLGWKAWRELAAALRQALAAPARRADHRAAAGRPRASASLTPSVEPMAPAVPTIGRRGAALGAGVIAALLPAVLLALEPPLGFDATMYHLPFAKAFAATGRLPFLPALRFPVFPQLDEMLFALALLLDGDAAAQLLMVLATLLTAGLLLAWGRSAWGAASPVGWFAAAALAGNPLVVYLAASAYIDSALALWVTAACYCVHRSRIAANDLGWLLWAGAFAGAAAAGKYLGLYFVVALAAVVAWRQRRQALWFAVGAAAVMAPWYGRILYYTQNPVFPYFPRWFGSTPWNPVRFHPEQAVTSPADVGAHLLTLLRLPWDSSLGWRAAGALAPLSPLYLAALPLLAAAFLVDGRVRRLLCLVLAFVAATVVLPREPRYLMAVLPLLSLATAAVMARYLTPLAPAGWPARPRLVAVLCAALLLPGWLYGLDRLRRLGLPPASAAARDGLLARRLPLYAALRYLNRAAGSRYTAYGWQTENLKYFADGQLLGDWSGPAAYPRLPPLDGDPDVLAAALRRLDAGYLILPARGAPPGCAASAAFRRRFALRFADGRGCVFSIDPEVADRAAPAADAASSTGKVAVE